MSTATAALPHHHRAGTIRAALSYREFRILFIGSSLSNVGTWMQNFILPTYIDDRTHSAALVGALFFAQLGPMLLLSIPAGALADRFDRTRLVMAMQATMLVLSITLGLLAGADAPLWALFAVQLGVGIASALQAPAFSASLPMMVARPDLPGAVSLNSAQLNGSRILGPALAALLAATGLSLPSLFIANSATYLFMIVPLMFIKLPQPEPHPDAPRGIRGLSIGLATARRRGVVWRSLATMCLFSVVCLPYIGLFPSVARLNFGISSTSGTYKALYIVWGLGAFFGALAVGTRMAGVDKRRLVRVSLAAFAVCLGVFALLSDVAIAFPVALMLGFAYFVIATALASILQQNLADSERATVMPLWFMAFGGSVPIGNLIGGPLIDLVGARPVLLVGAVFALVLAEVFDLRKLGEHDFLPEHHGGDRFVALEPARRRARVA
ncbi:MAG TPA: MFS transporter [Ilumatobacter sp.]|nr:MFS transporter [Ilumatobacter sp.]